MDIGFTKKFGCVGGYALAFFLFACSEDTQPYSPGADAKLADSSTLDTIKDFASPDRGTPDGRGTSDGAKDRGAPATEDKSTDLQALDKGLSDTSPADTSPSDSPSGCVLTDGMSLTLVQNYNPRCLQYRSLYPNGEDEFGELAGARLTPLESNYPFTVCKVEYALIVATSTCDIGMAHKIEFHKNKKTTPDVTPKILETINQPVDTKLQNEKVDPNTLHWRQAILKSPITLYEGEQLYVTLEMVGVVVDQKTKKVRRLCLAMTDNTCSIEKGRNFWRTEKEPPDKSKIEWEDLKDYWGYRGDIILKVYGLQLSP